MARKQQGLRARAAVVPCMPYGDKLSAAEPSAEPVLVLVDMRSAILYVTIVYTDTGLYAA